MSDWVVVFIVACVTLVALVGICAWYDIHRGDSYKKKVDKKYQLPGDRK